MQRHIQFEVRTDLDDHSHQPFHLVASCHQLVEALIHLAHQLTPPVPLRLASDLPGSSTTELMECEYPLFLNTRGVIWSGRPGA
jgi:hypothetical protein